MINRILACFALCAAGLAATPVAMAQETDGWNAQITPYVWGAGIGGDLTPFTGAPTLSFSKSLSEVLEDSEGAFFLSGFARKNRFVIMGDLSWSASAKDGVVPPGLPAEGGLEQTSATLAAGYRAHATPDLTVDLLAGVRFWDIRVAVDVAGGAIMASRTEKFADPILAIRANITLAPRWTALVYADVGGFGLGSDQTTQFVVTANYAASDRLYLSGGLRALSVDYSSGGTRIDATMAGPLVGLTWRF